MSKEMKVGLCLLVVVALALSFTAGWNLGTSARSGAAGAEGFELVEEAWNIILRDYVGKDSLDTDELARGAINGMVGVLGDPHTSYLDSETYQVESGTLDGSIEGIGATMTIVDGQPTVVAVYEGSPAAEGGLAAGDRILEIDGKPTSDMSLAETVLNIRGPAGTQVSLLVLHEDNTEPELIEITRAKINVPSVEFEALGDIAYIRISYFSGRTAEELSPVVSSVNLGGYTGAVIDLRGNPGGLLDVVVDVTSRFVSEGVVVYIVGSDGERTALDAKSEWEVIRLPMVVLVDGYSASGAEVLAGALQDYKLAVVAGTVTYGKGSAGVMEQLEDGSAIYITTSRWLTPNGRLIEGEGLLPDYELDFGEVDAVQWAIDYLKGKLP